MANENLKELVGKKAAYLVKNNMTIGLGTGSTVFYTIQELGNRIKKENLKFKAVPSSIDTENKCKNLGIETLPFSDLDKVEKIDLAIDGADEVDEKLNLIKGGGGAHLREKKIAYKSKKFVVIVDESKISDVLGRFPVPVEVEKEKWEADKERLEKLGANVNLRQRKGMASLQEGEASNEPFVTDNGNYILDAKFFLILKPASMEDIINNIEGVVENGLFRNDKVSEVWVATTEGEVKVLK